MKNEQKIKTKQNKNKQTKQSNCITWRNVKSTTENPLCSMPDKTRLTAHNWQK